MRAGECHVAYFMLTSFKNTVEQVSDAACREVLRTLCALFGLSEVLDGAMWSSLLDGLDETRAQMAASLACSLLRPNAVALVDSFEYPDLILNSTLGREDGNVYEAMYKATLESPLNKRFVPEWLEKIKPHLDLEYLALRNGEEGAANIRPVAKL
jgi:acyl-CoA oxidase